jgi:hypothetical protein
MSASLRCGAPGQNAGARGCGVDLLGDLGGHQDAVDRTAFWRGYIAVMRETDVGVDTRVATTLASAADVLVRQPHCVILVGVS